MARTWTAEIKVYDPRTRTYTRMAATDSEWDLLRDQTGAAVREALPLVDECEVSVVMFKTTKAHGTRQDRVYNVWRDARGMVRYQ